MPIIESVTITGECTKPGARIITMKFRTGSEREAITLFSKLHPTHQITKVEFSQTNTENKGVKDAKLI